MCCYSIYILRLFSCSLLNFHSLFIKFSNQIFVDFYWMKFSNAVETFFLTQPNKKKKSHAWIGFVLLNNTHLGIIAKINYQMVFFNTDDLR